MRIGRDHALDLLPGAVARMAFDEDDFEIVVDEAGMRLTAGFDVAALVARRHHDRRRRHLESQMPQRAAHRVVPQAQLTDQRQGRQEPIDEGGPAQEPQRKQHAPFGLDRLEVGERDQRAHVRGRQNVLRRLRHLQADRLGEFQRRIPQVRK